MKYRCWMDDKRWTEEEDGEEVEAPSAFRAAELFAQMRYDQLRHIDPGRVWVRRSGEEKHCYQVFMTILFTASRTKGIYNEEDDDGNPS